MAAQLIASGTGKDTRISADKAVAAGGKMIPTDPRVAGLPVGQHLSADPTTAAAQILAGINVV